MLVEIKATGVCHTDEFTLSGADPEGLFPAILGHEGAGVVVDIGKGVTSVKKAITSFRCTRRNAGSARPACRARPISAPRSAPQGQGLMPDGTSRFSMGGKPVHHYMGTSTFANYTVLPEIAVAKSARTRRSTRSATSAAASRQGSAPSSTPRRSSKARKRSFWPRRHRAQRAARPAAPAPT